MKLKQAILSLLLCLISFTAQAQQFSPFIDTRLRSTATGTKPAMRSGALLELIGYTTATDGFHSVVQYLPGSALVVDNIFVFAPKAGQPGRLVAVDRSFLDLEFAGLEDGDDIQPLLTAAIPNMAGGVVRIRFPRSIDSLSCSPYTFPANIARLEIQCGNSTLSSLSEASETMWTIPNPGSVLIEPGAKFSGRAGPTFTDSEAGLIVIDGTNKTGVGGSIECYANFSNTISTGLAIVGVDNEINAYQSIRISGEYIDSGLNASSIALDRSIDVSIHDLDNNNAVNPGSRRYTPPPRVNEGVGPESLSQGNVPNVSARLFLGHDWLEDQIGVNGNANAFVDLPAGSVVQLTSAVRIPSGVTITTDAENPATIIHPPTGQPCLGIQGADILIENVILDFAMGSDWIESNTLIAFTLGGFFTGDGASALNFNYDGESGTFVEGETITYSGGSVRLAALTDNGSTGSMIASLVSGVAPVDNSAMTGGASGATAAVNGSVTVSGSVPDRPIRDVTIRNVTFINSDDTLREPSDTGDAWCISFGSNNGAFHNEPPTNITVENCTGLTRAIQLTANGNDRRGINGLTIRGCYVKFGFANTIAWSTSIDDAIVENVLIEDNIVDNVTSAGIFVGQDGSGTDRDTTVRNVTIRNNTINFDSTAEMDATAILVRASLAASDIVVQNNVINALAVPAATPNWLSLTGATLPDVVEFQASGNHLLGSNLKANIGTAWVEVFDDDPLMTALACFWPVDEASGSALDANDRYKLNLIETSGTIAAVSAGGPDGQDARRFASADTEYFTFTDSPATSIQNQNTSFTFAGWLRLTTEAANQGIISKYSGTNGGYRFAFLANTGSEGDEKFSLTLTNSALTSVSVACDTFGDIDAGVWYFVAFGYRANSNKMWISVNGVMDEATGVSLVDTTHNFNFGWNTSSYLDGDAFGWGLWKRYLTPANITELYGSGAGLTFEEFGL